MSDASVRTPEVTGKRGTDHGFERSVKRFGQHVEQLHDDLAGVVRDVGEVTQAGVAAAKEGGRKTTGDLKARGERAGASLGDAVSSRPGTALAIAVGVGVLIGLLGPVLLRPRRRSS